MSPTEPASTPAPVAGEELNDADALAAFESFAAAKADSAEDDDPEETPVADKTPAATQSADATPTTDTTPAAPAQASAAPNDIWASATPELRAAHEAALADKDHRYRSDLGRQASLQRQVQLLREQLASKSEAPAAPKEGDPAPTKTSLRENPAIKKALEDYPEVGLGPVLDAIEAQNAENERVRRELSAISEDRRASVISDQTRALTAAHPDWQAAVTSDDFKDWLSHQPKAVKEIVQRNGADIVDAEEAIAMVDAFKAHYALTHPRPPVATPSPATPPTSLSERRAAQLAAVTTAPKGGPTATPDGAPGGEAKALFDHFVAKKANQR